MDQFSPPTRETSPKIEKSPEGSFADPEQDNEIEVIQNED